MSRGQAFFRYAMAAPLILMAASCAVVPPSAPPPAPPPAVTPPPPPPPPTAPTKSWEDRDLNAGDWYYDTAARTARFTSPGQAAPLLTLQCDRNSRNLVMRAALGNESGSQEVQLITTAGTDRLTFVGGQMRFDARDGRLDRIAFSRGRFALDAANGRHLTLPVYAEIGRVIEDCRE